MDNTTNMESLLDIHRIISSTSDIDNIYDLVFLSYIGKYVYELEGVTPDFGKFKCNNLENMSKNKNLMDFIYECGQRGWINDTLEFYKEFGHEKLDESGIYLPVELKPLLTQPLSGLGVRPYYTRKLIISNTYDIRNNQIQFAMIDLIAGLLVRKYFNAVDKNTNEVNSNKYRIDILNELLYNKYNLVYFTHVYRYPEVNNLIYIKDKFYEEEYSRFLYASWGYDNIQRGYFTIYGATKKDKYNKIKSDPRYKIGMPLVLYRKDSNFISSNWSDLVDAEIVIIDGYDKDKVILRKTGINNTRAGVKAYLSKNMQARELYLSKGDFDLDSKTPSEVTSYDLDDISVEGIMTLSSTELEKAFFKENKILPRQEESYVLKSLDENLYENLYIGRPDLPDIQDDDYRSVQLEMTYIDAIYWLLKDWDEPFDEENYKDVYDYGFEYYKAPLFDMSTPQLALAMIKSDRKLNNEEGKIIKKLNLAMTNK